MIAEARVGVVAIHPQHALAHPDVEPRAGHGAEGLPLRHAARVTVERLLVLARERPEAPLARERDGRGELGPGVVPHGLAHRGGRLALLREERGDRAPRSPGRRRPLRPVRGERGVVDETELAEALHDGRDQVASRGRVVGDGLGVAAGARGPPRPVTDAPLERLRDRVGARRAAREVRERRLVQRRPCGRDAGIAVARPRGSWLLLPARVSASMLDSTSRRPIRPTERSLHVQGGVVEAGASASTRATGEARASATAQHGLRAAATAHWRARRRSARRFHIGATTALPVNKNSTGKAAAVNSSSGIDGARSSVIPKPVRTLHGRP